MSASTMAGGGIPAYLIAQCKRIGPLGFIVLLHVAFFYALQSGLLRQAADAVPKEVFATFITPDAPKPETPSQEPAPKAEPVVKKVTPKPAPVRMEPSERAIAAQPAAPSPPPAAPAAPAPNPAPPKMVSGVEYIQPPQPDYPPTSRRLGEEGKVMVRVLVNERGRAERAEVQKTSGFPRLDEAAREAALRALFKPYIEDGKPVAVFAVIPVRFQLDN